MIYCADHEGCSEMRVLYYEAEGDTQNYFKRKTKHYVPYDTGIHKTVSGDEADNLDFYQIFNI